MDDLPIIVLVDDDTAILAALKRALRSISANIYAFDSPLEAIQFCEHTFPNVIISDQHMPDMDGCTFLANVKKRWPNSQRIILSAYHDFKKISSAFNAGVVERFICKPWDNKELLFVIDKALNSLPENSKTKNNDSYDEPINFHGIIAADDTMHDLFDSIRHAATTNAPIFVMGETGTGKELVAQACHQESYHKDEPFIAVNCANFNENLIESQLFGHIKGAFTGATTNQEGLFAAAKHGTLFLDEICSLSLSLQAKLLRVIQEREFSPIGTHKIHKFHAQIISASSNSISSALLNGDFREDLYYRLNVITVALPPLRDRGADILLIARYFLKKFSKIESKQFTKLSRDAIKIMCSYDWPGNIRQLENIIHGMIILNTGTQITAEMIIKSLSTTVNGFITRNQPSRASIEHTNITKNTESINTQRSETNIQPLWLVEKEAIEAAISYCGGNVPKAAALLEVSPSTLYRKKQSWA